MDVLVIVGIDLVDHFDSIRQPDGVHAGALDLGHDSFDRLVLETLWDHHVRVARPVDARVRDISSRSIVDVASRRHEGSVGPVCSPSMWHRLAEAGERKYRGDNTEDSRPQHFVPVAAKAKQVSTRKKWMCPLQDSPFPGAEVQAFIAAMLPY